MKDSDGTRRMPWKLIIVVAGILAVVFGGELILLLAEELVELVVDVTQTAFMLLYERAFGLPYEKAQGRAAWTSLFVLVALVLLGAWRLAPNLARAFRNARQGLRALRTEVGVTWQSAPWYRKLAYVAGGLVLLAGLVLII